VTPKAIFSRYAIQSPASGYPTAKGISQMKKNLPLALLLALSIFSHNPLAQTTRGEGAQQPDESHVLIRVLVFSTKNNEAVRSFFGGGTTDSIWRAGEFQEQLRALRGRGAIKSESEQMAIVTLGRKVILATGLLRTPLTPKGRSPNQSGPNIYLEGRVDWISADNNFGDYIFDSDGYSLRRQNFNNLGLLPAINHQPCVK
jgi:hypothetical protein